MDDDSSIIIAGVLCILLTGFLCCRGEPPPAPVSVFDAPNAGVLVARGKRDRHAAPKVKAQPKPAREVGGPGTRTGDEAAARALV